MHCWLNEIKFGGREIEMSAWEMERVFVWEGVCNLVCMCDMCMQRFVHACVLTSFWLWPVFGWRALIVRFLFTGYTTFLCTSLVKETEICPWSPKFPIQCYVHPGTSQIIHAILGMSPGEYDLLCTSWDGMVYSMQLFRIPGNMPSQVHPGMVYSISPCLSILRIPGNTQVQSQVHPRMVYNMQLYPLYTLVRVS